MAKALRVIGLWLGVTLLILIAGGIWVISEYTLVNHWLFFGSILFISVILTAICARFGYLLPVTKIKALRIIVTALTATIVIAGIALATNYVTADFKTVEPTKAVIVRKYQQTHHRTRRSGRRSYERGESYQVYKLDLRLLPTLSKQDSRIIKIETSRTGYAKFHEADTVTVSIAKGFLRLPVISPSSLKPLHPRPAKPKARAARRHFS